MKKWHPLCLWRTVFRPALTGLTAFLALHSADAQPAQIPTLSWTERSDWTNVKTDLPAPAAGDGVTDDTQALQSALNLFTGTSAGVKVVYLPPGTYRITQTLTWPSSVGCSLIGHGQATRIVWAGPSGLPMLRTDGAAQATFTGIVWDGGNRSNMGTGVYHNAKSRFESGNRHQHEAFLNLHRGIAGDYSNGGRYATSEMVIDNCLFENCNTGIQFSDSFNYYNETVTRSEFRNCGVGVRWGAGYGYIRFCRFEGSTTADVIGSQKCSIRFSTSVNSAMFHQGANAIPAILQNNVISGCTGNVAVTAGDGSLIFDNTFLQPSSSGAPIQLLAPSGTALAIVSNNRSPQTNAVYGGATGFRQVPAGTLIPLQLQPGESFLQTAVEVPTKVFDAKTDFGAVANGSNDDTAAVRACINAARAHGQGAIAYFPPGQYRISSTIDVTGSNYVIGGSGYYTEFRWSGPPNGVVFQVTDPVNLRMESFSMQDYLLPAGTTAIRQSSSSAAPSSMVYDRLTLVQGPQAYSSARTREGLHLVNLSSTTRVHLGQILGTVRITDSGQATILGEMMNTSGELIDGALLPKTGFTGFLTRNGVNLLVDDNNDIVVGDCNMEQSSPWNQPNIRGVRVSGGSRAGTGQVTIGAMKLNLFDTAVIAEASNYEGLFSVFHTSIAEQNHPFAEVLHSGTRVLDLLLGLNFAPKSNPLLVRSGPGARLRNVRNFHRYYQTGEAYGAEAAWSPSPKALGPSGAGQAMDFDGVNDFLLGARTSAFSGNLSQLTIQAWVCPASSANTTSILVAHQYPEMNPIWSSNVYSLEMGPGNQVRFMVRNNTSPYAPYYSPWSQTVLTPGQWHLVTGVWDGTSVRIHVNDGPAEGTTATPAFGRIRDGGNSHLSRVLIGGGESRFFAGKMDELRFYNTALDQAAIDAAYNNGAGTYAAGNEPGLFACYHFDEGSGRNAYDPIGAAHALFYQYKTDVNPPDTDLVISDALDHFRELAFHGREFNFGLEAPSGLTASAVSPYAVDLTWVDRSTRETGFRIEYATDPSFAQNVSQVEISTPNVTAQRVSGLQPSTTYHFRMRALSGATLSAYSNVATATTGAPVETTITVDAAADAYVRSGNYINANYGTTTGLYVKNDAAGGDGQHEAYIKFALPPASGVLVSAKLRIYISYGTAASTHRAHLVANDGWTETGITFANKPLWGSQIASWNPSPSAAYKEIPLNLELIRNEQNGDRVLSIRISNDTNGYHSYRSREFAGSKPSLILTTQN